MKKVKTYKQLNKTEVRYDSDNDAGEYLDTDIYIGVEYICTIEGNKISEFHEKLEQLVNTYRI